MLDRKVIGVGNAIFDIVCEVDEEFLSQHSLVKGSMSLIDEAIAGKLSKLQSVKISSGGSAGNTIATISQLGTPSSFIGKVSADEFGKKFVAEIEKSGAYYTAKNYANSSSAKSFILVTKDGQRTMCTFLGCASEITTSDIDEEAIKGHEILYLEGYLWDQDSTIEALRKAIRIAKENKIKIAFTLSDFFCVARHKKDFLDLIESDLDILFANEQEIQELLDIKNIANDDFSNLNDFFAKNKNLIAAITRGENGYVVFDHGKLSAQAAYKIDKVIDSTGAGDAFAAGFLHEFSNGKSAFEAARKGNLCASKIIQKFGARFDDQELKNL